MISDFKIAPTACKPGYFKAGKLDNCTVCPPNSSSEFPAASVCQCNRHHYRSLEETESAACTSTYVYIITTKYLMYTSQKVFTDPKLLILSLCWVAHSQQRPLHYSNYILVYRKVVEMLKEERSWPCCVCVCACVHACVRACVRACVCVCTPGHLRTFFTDWQ